MNRPYGNWQFSLWAVCLGPGFRLQLPYLPDGCDMLKLPIGIQDFRKLRKGGYLYVDKIRFLYRLITEGAYYFLSRPRRFGKSLLISTLEAIFSGEKRPVQGFVD